MNPPYLLVLYYSKHGSVANLAKYIARGASQIPELEVKVRQVPEVSSVTKEIKPSVPSEGAPYCTLEELEQCAGLALGSPSYFGGIAAPLKHFLDQSSTIWMTGGLQDKPAAVFTSASTMHGGQEQCLQALMTPLLHHGMIIQGLPYSKDLVRTLTGGTPYGASHYAANTHANQLSEEELSLCETLGQRLGKLCLTLYRAR